MEREFSAAATSYNGQKIIISGGESSKAGTSVQLISADGVTNECTALPLKLDSHTLTLVNTNNQDPMIIVAGGKSRDGVSTLTFCISEKDLLNNTGKWEKLPNFSKLGSIM